MSPAIEEAREAIGGVERWYHRIEVMPGLVTPGEHDSPYVLEQIPFPADCTGMSVLDIGARDGFFSFEAERRGAAEVIAMDIFPAEYSGFPVARGLLGSRVEFVTGNVYDLRPELHGGYDVVLFLGVLYHLRNPMLALDRIRDICRGQLVVETEIAPADGTDGPIARFHPDDTLKGDATNYWTPNLPCLRAMLEAARFEVQELSLISETRAAALATPDDDPRRRHLQRFDYISDVRFADRGRSRSEQVTT